MTKKYWPFDRLKQDVRRRRRRRKILCWSYHSMHLIKIIETTYRSHIVENKSIDIY